MRFVVAIHCGDEYENFYPFDNMDVYKVDRNCVVPADEIIQNKSFIYHSSFYCREIMVSSVQAIQNFVINTHYKGRPIKTEVYILDGNSYRKSNICNVDDISNMQNAINKILGSTFTYLNRVTVERDRIKIEGLLNPYVLSALVLLVKNFNAYIRKYPSAARKNYFIRYLLKEKELTPSLSADYDRVFTALFYYLCQEGYFNVYEQTFISRKILGPSSFMRAVIANIPVGILRKFVETFQPFIQESTIQVNNLNFETIPNLIFKILLVSLKEKGEENGQ